MGELLESKSLLYVTGKGGVGKTTIAAALGIAAAQRGRRTIVCEVSEQRRLAEAFTHVEVNPEVETELAENLWAITIDPSQALTEWLRRQLGGGPLLRTVSHSHTFQYFVAAAPGAKELITIAKVWELAQPVRWDQSQRAYDLVIVDAPASGHGIAMLETPTTFGEIARVGPIQKQAARVRDTLVDPHQTGYLAVALPEETPVNETLELERQLRAAVGLDFDRIIVNGIYPDSFSKLEVQELETLAKSTDDDDVRQALTSALTQHARARNQRRQLRRLRSGAKVSAITLPFIFDEELGMSGYQTLAAELTKKLKA